MIFKRRKDFDRISCTSKRSLSVESLESRRVLAASISLGVTVGGQDSSALPGPQVSHEAQLQRVVEVSNNGTVALSGLAVTSDGGTVDDSSDDLHLRDVTQDPAGDTAAIGSVQATLSIKNIDRFERHTWQPLLYAISDDENQLTVINTETLQIVDEILIGSNPRGITISDDGSRLYVSIDPSIVVIDTATNDTLTTLPFDQVRDLATGADGNLFALSNDPGSSFRNVVTEIDASSGNVVQSFTIDRASQIAVSPAKDRLYAADYGYSPASLFQYDLTVDPPAVLWESPHGGLSGSNGQHLELSADGTFVSYATGSGQGGYRIAKYRTNDMTIDGTFNTGAYPREITFSPDGQIAYTVNNSGEIKTWSTETYRSIGIIDTGSIAGEADELVVDRDGRFVFGAFPNELVVFSTGRDRAINVGDTNSNGLMDPGETWQFTARDFAKTGAQQAEITVTGFGEDGDQVSAAITSHYIGQSPVVVTPMIDIDVTITINGHDGTAAPGPTINVGDLVEKSIRVTNTGNTPVSLLSVTSADIAVSEDIPMVQGFPSLGAVSESYPIENVDRFAEHPTKPLLYTISSETNLLTVVDTLSETIQAEIEIGSAPRGLTLSDDGSRLYVAIDPEIVVIDTVTNDYLPSLPWTRVHDLVTGPEGHLYGLRDDFIHRIDPATGFEVGTEIGVRASQMVVSPSKDRLYAADYGYSPASLYQYDITVDPPVLLWESPHGSGSGSNGQDLAISRDGAFVSYATGSGQSGYDIAHYRTSDMVINGSFDVGAYPREITFSTDGTVAYTVNRAGLIRTWNTQTYLERDDINTSSSEEARELLATDRHLYAAFSDQLVAFYPGRPDNSNAGDVNGNGVFDPGEEWLFMATDTAGSGSHSATISIVADSVSETFECHYLGVTGAELQLTTTLNGQAPNVAPGTTVQVGNALQRDYFVHNNGIAPLRVDSLVDDAGTMGDESDNVSPSYVSGDANANGILDPGETWGYSASINALSGLQTMTSLVTTTVLDDSNDPIAGESPLTDSNEVYYNGLDTEFTFRLFTNGSETPATPGPSLDYQSNVVWQYEVSNVGTMPLTNVVVVDDFGTPGDSSDDVQPAFVSGDTNNDTVLSPGETWNFQLTGIVGLSQYANTAVFTADDALGAIEKSATGYHYGRAAMVDFAATIDGETVGDAVILRSDQTHEIGYRLHNDGNEHLGSVTVIDDLGTEDDTDDVALTPISGDTGNDGILSPNETWLFELPISITSGGSVQHQADFQADVVDENGNPLGRTLNESLTVAYVGEFLQIHLGVSTSDGTDDSGTLLADVGATVQWEISVENQGSVSLSNLAVIDDLGNSDELDDIDATAITQDQYNVGDVDKNGEFDPGESWSFVVGRETVAGINEGTIRAIALRNESTVSANEAIEFVGLSRTDIKESVSEAAIVADLAATNWEISDARFELIDGTLMLRPEQYLTYDDNGIVVMIANADTGQVLHAVIIEVIENPQPWQNAKLRHDVNDNGEVTANDALVIINEIGIRGQRSLEARPASEQHYFDANGDLVLTVLDALYVINELKFVSLEAEQVSDFIAETSSRDAYSTDEDEFFAGSMDVVPDDRKSCDFAAATKVIHPNVSVDTDPQEPNAPFVGPLAPEAVDSVLTL